MITETLRTALGRRPLWYKLALLVLASTLPPILASALMFNRLGAPGGLEAMMILSFLLGLDPAYIGAHQFARFLGIAVLLPLMARRYLPPADRAAP